MPPGPVPKRESERIRRNKPVVPTDTIRIPGEVAIPKLGLGNVHPLVQDLYDSMAESGQSKYYEPSDWQMARLVCYILNEYLNSPKPSAQMVMALQSLLSDLLLTEGSRRRLRLEIERAEQEVKVDDNVQAVVDLYAQMFNEK